MKKSEICLECGADYIPTRRGVQKFCSNSCRSRYWFNKQEKKLTKNLPYPLPTPKSIPVQLAEPAQLPKQKVEEVSLAGVGNAALGVAAVNLLNKIATKEENMHATKNDIQKLIDLINKRYFLVHNMTADGFGRKPHFDMGTGNIIYL